MRYSIVALMILVGCGTEPEIDEEDLIEYPIQVGTWQIESATEANWKGAVQQPQKAFASTDTTDGEEPDTLYIDRPDGQELSIWDERVVDWQPKAYFSFVDPNIPVSENDLSYEVEFSERSFISGNEAQPGGEINPADTIFAIEHSIGYQCGAEEVRDENASMMVQIYHIDREADQPKQIERVYIFEVNGMSEVLDHIHCAHLD